MATGETAAVSEHMLRVFLFVEKQKGWVTAAEVASGASVESRTARSHCLRLVKLGLFDQAEVFPAHRYRMSSMATKRNRAMVQRLREAQKVIGGE